MEEKKERFNWPPLESSPEIFYEYMHSLGLKDSMGFFELYGFDEELLMMNPQPVYGVILAYERLIKDKE
jgi:ubiquitin carboxyl-terminal hydrolase L3